MLRKAGMAAQLKKGCCYLYCFILVSFTPPIMNPQLENLQKASDGLLFMSESDYPFEVVAFSLENNTIDEQLQTIAQKNQPVEHQSLEYFFRNAIKEYPGASESQKESAHQFQALQEALKNELKDVQVYRLGQVQIDAFIIGQLKDGSYGGLRTKLIET